MMDVVLSVPISQVYSSLERPVKHTSAIRKAAPMEPRLVSWSMKLSRMWPIEATSVRE